MSLQDSIFAVDVENDVTIFVNDGTRKRVLVFPPVNNYRRFLIHQLVQEKFPDLLHTFSIGEGFDRRTVICYKSDVIRGATLRDSKSNGGPSIRAPTSMGVEGEYPVTVSSEHSSQKDRQAMSGPTVGIYRPPAVRRSQIKQQEPSAMIEQQRPSDSTPARNNRQRRPDRAVYVPRHRREKAEILSEEKNPKCETEVEEDICVEIKPEDNTETTKGNETPVQRNDRSIVSEVLIISEPKKPEISPQKEVTVPVVAMTPPEKKVKKIERPKSKPAPPPAPPKKINRDECDWDSLFDDNGDCLDPTLTEELTQEVGKVVIEQPKSDYKAYSRPVEISNDEFAHVVEIYNFPADFKTCDLVGVFASFKDTGFEFKWVDDTHCLGVFSSPRIAAEVLASDHPFVKTRPLSEATASSKTKARRSSEFLQPFKARPETCAALARRLVTGALGVKLSTARQEREREKVVLREAKEKKRLANKQRDDVWEGIIAEKSTS